MAVTWAVVWKVLGALVLILPMTAYVAGRVAGPPEMATAPIPMTDSPPSQAPHPTVHNGPDSSTHATASPRNGGGAHEYVGAASARSATVPQRSYADRHKSQQRPHRVRTTSSIRDTIRVLPDRPMPRTPQDPTIVLPEAPPAATPTDTPVMPESPAPSTPSDTDPGAPAGGIGGGTSPSGGPDIGIVPIAP